MAEASSAHGPRRTALVTGATDGIGREIARALARAGARLVLTARSRARGEAVRDELARDTGNEQVEILLVDLSRLASMRSAFGELAERLEQLDVLVNNAGVVQPKRTITEDGFELTWATNVLGYHLPTRLLTDLLIRSAPARIVNVASMAAGGLDVLDVHFERRRYSPSAAYDQSKQANRMLSWAVAEELAGSGVTVNACHPGGVRTKLLSAYVGGVGGLFGRSPAAGADTPVWLATEPNLERVTGRWWVDRRERPCEFRDLPRCRELARLCDEMIA